MCNKQLTGEDVMKILGRSIKKIRTLKKLSQEELGFRLGNTNSGTISNIENGKAFVSAKNIALLCNTLGVLPKDLFGSEDFLKYSPNNTIIEDMVMRLNKIENRIGR